MTKLIIAIAALVMLATAVPAQSRNCNTTCTTIGNQQHCNTFCY